MTELSPKQEIFKNYLIKKLGFVEDTFMKKYVSLLEMVSPKLRLLGKQKKIWSEESQSFKPEKEDPFNSYIEKEDYFVPEKFNVIDFLKIELNIKKNSDYTLKDIQLNFISASDISNFTYCPVSLAISKTFELPKLESTITGTLQHEKQRLINYLRPFKTIEYEKTEGYSGEQREVESTLSFNPLLNNSNQLFFDELTKSSIVFYGHDSNETKNKFYKSLKGNFVGQPDYIFKNDITNEIFVVEEKFQFVPLDPSTFRHGYYTYEEKQNIIKKRASKTFFNNHINQLNSYIYGIGEYEIKYGYLVYWKYEMDYGDTNIISCNVLRIDKTEKGKQQIRETFINLKELIANKGGKFNINLRVPAKCASCVSNLLCGHKTGKFSSFSIPYSTDYLKVYFADFPEELKKEIEPPNSNTTSELTQYDNFI